MLSLILALVVGQVQSDPTLQWRNATNWPGWQSYGPILPSGWVDPVKFRRINDPGVEYPALGREAEFVPSPGVQFATNVAVQQPLKSALVASVAQQVALVAKQVAHTAEQVARAAQPDQVKQSVQVQQSVQVVSDPYGFTAWLNSTRAAYGLPAVGYDPSLSGWAAMNNSAQASYGIGHFVQGPARRQNAAMGSFPGIESMWMQSPAHAAALLDPTIRWIGIAGLGAWWTFNGY